MRLGPGKSFGEKALITNQCRSADVVCTLPSHLAVMSKYDYSRVLKKIELKIQTKIITFLQQIPYLSKWTKKQILNFQYFLTAKDYTRGALVFREGTEVDTIGIVKQGEFEVIKKINNNSKTDTNSFQTRKMKIADDISMASIAVAILGNG